MTPFEGVEGLAPTEVDDWADQAADIAQQIYEAVELCKVNQENGLPCRQTTAETVDEIYTTLNNFITTYNADQANTEAALTAIFTSLQQSEETQAWDQVVNDLTKGKRMFTILTSWIGCKKALAAATAGSAPTCQTSDINGIASTMAATPELVTSLAQEIVSIDANDPAAQTTPWYNDYQTLLPKISGSASSPYQSGDGSLLHAVVSTAAANEAAKQGLTPGTPLRFYSASYVNQVGQAVSSVVAQEAMYIVARIAAFGFNAAAAQPSSPNQAYLAEDAADYLAQMNGTNADGSAASLVAPTPAQQLTAYTFPGWSPSTPLNPNQAYFTGPNTAPVLLTNLGNSTSTPSQSAASTLPTATAVQNIATDIGLNPSQERQSTEAGGPYAVLSKLYPEALPRRTEPTIPNDSSLGRWWTAPQTTWNSWETNNTSPLRYTGTGSENLNGDPVPVTVLGSNFSIWGHPLTGSEIVSTSQLERTAAAYDIFGRTTDTQGDSGWLGDGGGATPLQLTGTPFASLLHVDPSNSPGSFGGPAFIGSSRLVTPTSKYPAGYAAPVWDVYGTAGGSFGAVASTFGAGLLVRTEGVEAANVTVQPMNSGGALQSGVASSDN